jgi:anti-sigma regulatory factor (Ser/Thr protein kinase)
VTRSFRAHPSALAEAREFVRSLAAEAEFPERVVQEFALAVSEACANAVMHTSTPDIRISWHVRSGCAEVVVQDRGVFRRQPMPPDDANPRGHGIPLMMALVDEVEIREGTQRRPGTWVRLRRCRDS